ncbi:MAG: hypothetical protein IKY20_06940 [Alistipes sp.]|nr:hypothetical protein [Alistipes sp.]
MNKILKLSSWMLAAAMLLTTACNENEEPTPQPKPEPETKLELTFSAGQVTSTTITYTITPNIEDATYYAQLFAAEELAAERDIAMKAALMTMEEAYTGAQTITVEELTAESEYKVLYFGYDAAEKRYTTDYLVSDVIKTADFEISETISLEVVAGSETWRNAFIKVQISDENLEYIFDIMEKSKWDELYAENPEAIVAARIAGWEQDVLDGLESNPTMENWQQYMAIYQHSYNQTINASEYYNMYWSTEYVMYAFGMNDEGFQTTKVATVEFATATPEASSNTFSVEIGELTASTVAFTVTAANNDPYFLTIQDKRYVERFFGENAKETWEDMIWDLTFVKTDEQIQDYIFSGSQSLTNADINKNVDTLHEYQVVIWGFNDGPTTEVYVSEAFQPQAEVREVKLWLEVLDVTHESVTCNVEVNYDDATYYAACITKEQLGDDYGATYFYEVMANVTADMLYTGTQDITFEGLSPESDYYVVAFGYDAELAEATTFLEYEPVRTMPVPSDGLFTISVSDITWRDATISVATELEDGYIFGIYTAEEFAATTTEEILAKRRGIWEDYAASYGSNWTDFMGYDMKYGNKTIYVKDDIQKLRWSTDYVFYCIALDAEGNAVSQMATKEFSTVTPTPSDCTFDISIDYTDNSSVKFTVTPSDANTQYYVTVQRQSVVSQYGPDQTKSYDDLIAYLIPDYDNQIEPRLFTGEKSISNSQLSNSVNSFYEYVVVVFGYDNGPTTTVFMSEAFKPGSN